MRPFHQHAVAVATAVPTSFSESYILNTRTTVTAPRSDLEGVSEYSDGIYCHLPRGEGSGAARSDHAPGEPSGLDLTH